MTHNAWLDGGIADGKGRWQTLQGCGYLLPDHELPDEITGDADQQQPPEYV